MANKPLDRSKRNISSKGIPTFSRDVKTLSPETSDESISPSSDRFTGSSLAPSGSNTSMRSTSPRPYSAAPSDRKARLAPPPLATSPEWYVKKIHDKTVTSKQLGALQALLQGKDVEWIQHFVELGGMSVLARWMFHSNRKGPDSGIELEVVKCLMFILNHRSTTAIALSEGANETVTHIASALDTPNLSTRRYLLDILVFLVYWNDGANCQTVISGLESLSEDNDEPANPYAFWFKSLQTVLAGRGKMGSRVGASEQLKKTREPDGALTEYLLSNILLMNGIMQAIDDLDVRLHYRSQMETCGLGTIIKLARSFGIAIIDKQLELFQQTLEEDERSLDERMHRINTCDLTNLGDVCNALSAKMKGSEKAETFLLSILQHLLLIHQDGTEQVHVLQLLDSVVGEIVLDKKLGRAEKRLGLSVERIVGQLEQIERGKAAEQDLVAARSTALHLKIEKEALEDRVARAEGHLAFLQAEVSQLRSDNARLSGKPTRTPLSPANSSYKDRISQLADVLPGSPLAVSHVPTNTPQPSEISKFTMNAARQPFWGLSSWFGSREDEHVTLPHTPPAYGLGIMDMKEDIMPDSISEKTS
ncbi:hypothetical protein BDW22DRAFT_1399208 [Trametopsis cervina]|nr:hypothetical protein BDW22DRAFT_1399208 [Trametopsis cervina]